MALHTSEITRIKYELGFSVLSLGAEPYIGITQLFENVIAPYTLSGASTTSSTTVTAAADPRVPEPVILVLASGTGFASGDRVVVDVDGRQETATAQAVSGASVSLLLALPHTGTYPVTVEGGESIIRELLRQIRAATDKLIKALGVAGVKKVDEVEFFSPSEMMKILGSFGALWQARDMLRRELAGVLGIDYLRDARGRGGGAVLSVH
jgi:hypothetical protein